MSDENSRSLTIFTFGKQAENAQARDKQLDNVDPEIAESEDTENILCIIFKGGKIGSAVYRDHMVSRFYQGHIPNCEVLLHISTFGTFLEIK